MVLRYGATQSFIADFNWCTFLVSLMSTVKAGLPSGMMQLYRIRRLVKWGGEVPPAIWWRDLCAALTLEDDDTVPVRRKVRHHVTTLPLLDGRKKGIRKTLEGANVTCSVSLKYPYIGGRVVTRDASGKCRARGSGTQY